MGCTHRYVVGRGLSRPNPPPPRLICRRRPCDIFDLSLCKASTKDSLQNRHLCEGKIDVVHLLALVLLRTSTFKLSSQPCFACPAQNSRFMVPATINDIAWCNRGVFTFEIDREKSNFSRVCPRSLPRYYCRHLRKPMMSTAPRLKTLRFCNTGHRRSSAAACKARYRQRRKIAVLL